MYKILIGYARVSATTQNEDRQILSLTEYGIKRANIYVDKQSGKDFKRPAYMRLMKKLKSNMGQIIKLQQQH